MNKDIFDYKINNLMKHLEINKDNLTKNFDFIKYELQAMIEDLMYQSFEDYRKSLKEIDRLTENIHTAIKDIFTLIRVLDANVKELNCTDEELKVINKYSYNSKEVKND